MSDLFEFAQDKFGFSGGGMDDRIREADCLRFLADAKFPEDSVDALDRIPGTEDIKNVLKSWLSMSDMLSLRHTAQQVYELADHLGVMDVIDDKPTTYEPYILDESSIGGSRYVQMNKAFPAMSVPQIVREDFWDDFVDSFGEYSGALQFHPDVVYKKDCRVKCSVSNKLLYYKPKTRVRWECMKDICSRTKKYGEITYDDAYFLALVLDQPFSDDRGSMVEWAACLRSRLFSDADWRDYVH